MQKMQITEPDLPKKKKKRGCQSRGRLNRQGSANTRSYEKNLLWDMKRKTKIAQLKQNQQA
jgi:hypothetical protein